MSNKQAEETLANLYNTERETYGPIFTAISSRNKAKANVDIRRLKTRVYEQSGKAVAMQTLEELFKELQRQGLGKFNPSRGPGYTSTFTWSPKVDHQGVLRTLIGQPGGAKVAPVVTGRSQPGQIPFALSTGRVINLTKQELQELSEIAQNL